MKPSRTPASAYLPGVAVLSLLVATSLPAQERSARVRSLAEIRHESVVMQQWDSSCGAAALATVLTYDLGDPVTERQVATGMLRRTDPIRVRTRGGFSLLNMQEFAQMRGFQAEGYGDLTLSDLKGMLPSIVPVQLHGYDHFVVVRAVRDGVVLFADPSFGNRKLPIAEFEQAWNQRVAFVVNRRIEGR